MKARRTFLAASVAALGAGLSGCAALGAPDAWLTLLDGSHPSDLDNWLPLGEGNWQFVDGSLEGKNGKGGYLVSKTSYTDFDLRAEFWVDETGNSGVFLRAEDPTKITPDNSYEVNIFDKRSDPSYGTGAIVNVAKVAQPGPKAAGRWNTYEVTARGDRLVVVLNGQQTVDVVDNKHRSGPIALQSAGGTIRFRKVQVRVL